MVHRDRMTVLSAPRGGQSAYHKLVFDGDKRIISVQKSEKLITQYDYYGLPVLFCSGKMLDTVCQVIKSDEDVVDSLISKLPIYTEALDRGFIESPIDTWEDVMRISNLIKILQDACGLPVYSIEEIVWRRGLITNENTN